MRIFLVSLLLAGGIAPLGAQSSTKAGAWERMQQSKDEMSQYLIRTGRRMTDAAAAEMSSKEKWEAVRDERRREFREMLGLDPLPPRTPLNVRITGILDEGEYTIEKIAFESMPRIYVAANLYVPKNRPGRLPTVIYVCGHASSAAGAKASMLQRHPITFSRHGYVSMILDTLESGEIFGIHRGVKNHEMYDWYPRGYNPSGIEVWNVMRALDYLETRPEVDKERFGITGISGALMRHGSRRPSTRASKSRCR